MSRALAFFGCLLLPLAGCPGSREDTDKPGDTAEEGAADGDGDGFVVGADCNDDDATVFPGADERCDGLDNDCDEAIDDDPVDATPFYADADADGYGDASALRTACEAPAGYVNDATDCNDADTATHPGAPESACTAADPDTNCNGVPDEADLDGDGYFSCDDCDDASAGVNPGAAEACDGLDNDCDGGIDDGVGVGTTYYADEDADGYGSEASALTACMAPPGHTTQAGDCDDATAAVNPDALEACNGWDDDCDGRTDEADAVDVITWYRDADADGYGDADSTSTACDAPSGYGSDASDCDDGNPTVYPAAPESCDGVDHDCDGLIEEADSVDVVAYYSDTDGDGYAGSVAGYACSAPSGYSAVADDCDEADASVHPGVTDVCDAVDNDCDGDVDDGNRVPDDHATIAAAISAAVNGESVCVAAGTWYETVDFAGKNITLQGEGSDVTTLDALGSGTVVRIDSGEVSAVLRGFTLTGGEAYAGAGLYVSGTSPTLDDLQITGNTCSTSASCSSSGGITYCYCYGTGAYIDGSPTVTDVSFDGNQAAPTGGTYAYAYGVGAYIYGSSGRFEGVSASDNSADITSSTRGGYMQGVGMCLYSDSANWTDLEVMGNSATRSSSSSSTYGYAYGTGLYLGNGSSSFDRVLVYANEAYLTGTYDQIYGGAMYVSYDDSSFDHLRVLSNYADAGYIYGGAIELYNYADLSFTNMIVAGNYAGYSRTPYYVYGAAFDVDYYSFPTFQNVDIVGNSATAYYVYGGGFYLGYYAGMTVADSSVSKNSVSATSAAYGGAIYMYSSSYSSGWSSSYSNYYANTSTEFSGGASSPVGSNGNVTVDPGYTSLSGSDASGWDLTLVSGSAMVDAGDPAELDADGSRADIGAYGGAGGDSW